MDAARKEIVPVRMEEIERREIRLRQASREGETGETTGQARSPELVNLVPAVRKRRAEREHGDVVSAGRQRIRQTVHLMSHAAVGFVRQVDVRHRNPEVPGRTAHMRGHLRGCRECSVDRPSTPERSTARAIVILV
jgi:hypothetical protein